MLSRTIQGYVRAFGRQYTYDVRRNSYLWFGFLWGIPVPIVSLSLDCSLGSPGRGPIGAVLEHPVHLFFLVHPFLFALIFGAMGTVRHKLEEENSRLIGSLTDLATTDLLTGLHNRRYVLGELAKALLRSRRTRQPFSLVLFDLDGFKQVNDTQGHLAGDQVLKHAATALRSICREGDVLGRYGGDEFLLISFGEPPLEETISTRADLAMLRTAGVGTSAGIANYPVDGETEEALINCADRHLAGTKAKRYAAKGTARRGVETQESASN
jgi:diguanylate cyclase (GGDEF)-like protein